MRLTQAHFTTTPSIIRTKCGTYSRLKFEIHLALLAELRNFVNPVALFTGAMNDRLNGNQTLPLSEIIVLIPRRPLVYLAAAKNPSAHATATSVLDQLSRFYEILFFTLRPMVASADPLTNLTPPEQRLMCHAWRMVCDRGLIALYELCRLDITTPADDMSTSIEMLCEALMDARSGRGLLYPDSVDGAIQW